MFLGERRREATFGIGLIVIVLIGVAVIEAMAQFYVARQKRDLANWSAILRDVGDVPVPRATDGFAASGSVRFRPGQRTGDIRINSFGLRGPEVAVGPHPDRVRIAFLGDSKVFSAELSEAAMLAPQTIRLPETAHPRCRFDHLTIAGPDYDAATLVERWVALAPALEPDAAVILTGATKHLIAAVRDEAQPAPASRSSSDAAPGRLASYALLRRLLHDVSPIYGVRDADYLPLGRMQAASDGMAGRLAAALGDTPVVAIGYRSRLLVDQSPAEQRRFSRPLRAVVPELSPRGAAVLSEISVGHMARAAAERGWRFIDTIKTMPRDGRHFHDATHFTRDGLALIARDAAAALSSMLGETCAVRADRPR